MIVTAVRAYRVRVQPTDPIRTGRGPVPARADLLVELVTDDGHSGWGNGSDSETGIAALAARRRTCSALTRAASILASCGPLCGRPCPSAP